ncbi:SDR family oxidoreductase [Sorangium sp. So ce1097]|uniref:SDR family oxidoreductase n=1 Tax=Sorangium sp. So ce1097 TaxID=3133330 RepID=UPI003F6364BD
MKPLEGQVALVTGATRGAGRAIACSLGEAGATVYCTGRSVRGRPATGQRPETIEETAERVTAAGGNGIAVQVDHTVEEQVEALCARIRREQGKLDVLVNDVWGGDELTEFGQPFWKLSVPKGKLLLERAVTSHIITSRHAVPILLERDRGLIVEVTDGDSFGYRGNLFYDLAKMSVIRLAFAMAWELRRHPGITALAITPGFLRSEAMLEGFGVTEENWRDATAKDPHFIASETPFYVGRAIAALAADPDVAAKSGRVFSSWDLAREYGFTDVDGRTPHWGEYFAKTFGECKKADEAAYAWWFNGPMDLAAPDWPKE